METTVTLSKTDLKYKLSDNVKNHSHLTLCFKFHNTIILVLFFLSCKHLSLEVNRDRTISQNFYSWSCISGYNKTQHVKMCFLDIYKTAATTKGTRL